VFRNTELLDEQTYSYQTAEEGPEPKCYSFFSVDIIKMLRKIVKYIFGFFFERCSEHYAKISFLDWSLVPVPFHGAGAYDISFYISLNVELLIYFSVCRMAATDVWELYMLVLLF
jgi:hypothetical protein